MPQSKTQKILAQQRQRNKKFLKQRDKELAEKEAKEKAEKEEAELKRKNLREAQGDLAGQQAAIKLGDTENRKGRQVNIPASKPQTRRLGTVATVAAIQAIPVGKIANGIYRVSKNLYKIGKKTYNSAAAARKARIATQSKVTSSTDKSAPVRSSKTTPSVATKARDRLVSTPNTSTPPPPVRQSRTLSPAMDAQRVKAAKDAEAIKRKKAAAKKAAEKARLEKAAAERKAMEAKRQEAVSQSQTAKEAAQRLRTTPNTSTTRPPVSQTRTSSSAMDAERTKVARQQRQLPANRKSLVTKLSTQPASKTGNVVKATTSQTVKATTQSIQKAAEAAKIKAKKGAEAAKVVAPQISKTAKTVSKSGTKSAAKAATALAVVNKEPKNGKSEIKGKMSSVKKVPKKGKAPKSKGVDTDDFSDEREAYTSLYNKNGKSRQSATRKSEEDKHWREIKKISKALGLKYMVPKLDEHGMPTDPDMLEAEVTSDAKGGLIGRPRKTTKVKIKKKAASKPKRKTSSTRKRKGFGGRGQGAALRGF